MHSPEPWRWDRMTEQLIDGQARPMGRRLSDQDGELAAAAPTLLRLLAAATAFVGVTSPDPARRQRWEAEVAELLERLKG
jgi:hypothetical protein